jgi:hypothetical protein
MFVLRSEQWQRTAQEQQHLLTRNHHEQRAK